LKKELDESKRLLSQSLFSVDRDNKHIYSELGQIIQGTNYDKRKPKIGVRKSILDSLYNASLTIDSMSLIDNLYNLTKLKLAMNDSLRSFASDWYICDYTTEKMEIFDFYEHSPFYKYGDTVKFVFSIRNPSYLLENNFELIGFSREELGSKENNSVTYYIPTAKFIGRNESHKDVDFNYQVVVRNTYSNKIDTMFLTKRFTIDR
jgi:hypothetical protein